MKTKVETAKSAKTTHFLQEMVHGDRSRATSFHQFRALYLKSMGAIRYMRNGEKGKILLDS